MGVQTPEKDQSTAAPSPSLAETAPDASHEVTINTTESGRPAHIDMDLQTPDTGATLSDLDRIGLGTRVIRTTRASGAIRGEQPSTSGIVDSQPASTSLDHQDLLGDTDMSCLDILDIDVDGSEHFSDIYPEMVDELLGGGPEEMIKNWVAQCNRDVTAGREAGAQPDLEGGCKGLDSANKAMDFATSSADCAQNAPGSPASIKGRAPEDIDATEGRSSTSEAQPGFIWRRNTFEIEKVGEFRWEDGQPLFLNAYPPVTRPTGLKVDDPDQAYRGQDLVDPAVIRPRHTRRERLRRQEEDRKKQQAGKVLPIPVASAETIERAWYSGSQVIEIRSQPWPKHLDGSSDHDTLAMCDRHVTDAAQQEPSFGKLGQTPALLTPGYLTIVTPGDDVILPAKETIEISAALPYARGRHQESIGERVIINDLYGVPLYKPAVGHIDPDLGTGAIAAKRIIDNTGADPNFVSDEVKRNSSTGTYPIMFQDRDSCPMRYTCRMDD